MGTRTFLVSKFNGKGTITPIFVPVALWGCGDAAARAPLPGGRARGSERPLTEPLWDADRLSHALRGPQSVLGQSGGCREAYKPETALQANGGRGRPAPSFP